MSTEQHRRFQKWNISEYYCLTASIARRQWKAGIAESSPCRYSCPMMPSDPALAASGADEKAGDGFGASDRITAIASVIRVSAERAAELVPAISVVEADELGWTQQAALSVRVDLDALAEQDIAILGLNLADGLRIFGNLTLSIAGGQTRRSALAKRRKLIISLSSAGFQMSGSDRSVGRWILFAIKVSDWRRPLRLDISNEAFVNIVYQEAMGRDADEGGKLNYLRELAEGVTKEQILRIFLLSEERMARISARALIDTPRRGSDILLVRDGSRHILC